MEQSPDKMLKIEEEQLKRKYQQLLEEKHENEDFIVGEQQVEEIRDLNVDLPLMSSQKYL